MRCVKAGNHATASTALCVGQVSTRYSQIDLAHAAAIDMQTEIWCDHPAAQHCSDTAMC